MEQTKRTDEKLSQLLFELLRLIKRELSCEELLVPSWLHLETLRFIAENTAPAMNEVAEYLKVKAPTATALITVLVKEGFVARTTDSGDRRRITLKATAKGKAALTSAAKKRERAFARVVARVSPRDRAEFARILSIITTTP